MTTPFVNNSDDEDTILMNELRINDEKLTKEMFDVVLDPNKILNVLTKKLQLYNETEAALKESRNKLIVGFMKVAVENRMMITQIKKDLDLKVGELTKQVEKLEGEEKKVP
jgi:sugar-specific transcriptional regulator TrmB